MDGASACRGSAGRAESAGSAPRAARTSATPRAPAWMLPLVLLATLAIVLSSGFFFARVDKDFIPVEDDARFMVSFRAPLGTSRATMEELVEQLDAMEFEELVLGFRPADQRVEFERVSLEVLPSLR